MYGVDSIMWVFVHQKEVKKSTESGPMFLCPPRERFSIVTTVNDTIKVMRINGKWFAFDTSEYAIIKGKKVN